MADDTSTTGNPDRQQINLKDGHEQSDWSPKRDVSREPLKEAMAKVGTRAAEVERELKGGA